MGSAPWRLNRKGEEGDALFSGVGAGDCGAVAGDYGLMLKLKLQSQ